MLSTATLTKSHFLERPSWQAAIHRLQIAAFLGWGLLLIRPGEVPDPFGLGMAMSWTAVCLVTVILVWPSDLLAGRWPSTSLDRILVVYIAIVILTAIPGVNRHSTLVAGLALTGNIGIFYTTVMLARRTPWLPEGILLGLATIIALLLMMAHAYHFELGILSRPKLYPIPEGWSGYPELGALAIVQFGVLLAGLVTVRRPAMVLALSVLILVNLVELVFLYSRATWPTVAGMTVLAALLGFRRRQSAGLLLVGVLVVVGSGMLMAANPTFRRLAQVTLWGQRASTTDVPQYRLDVAFPEARVLLWRRTVRMIGDHPLFGVGLGNFRQIFERDYNPEPNSDGTRGVHAHNLWLQQFAELGLMGGMTYCFLWTLVLTRAWTAAKRAWTFASVALLLSIAGMAASNLTTNMFYLTGSASGRLQSLTWVLFGLAVATPLRHEASAIAIIRRADGATPA